MPHIHRQGGQRASPLTAATIQEYIYHVPEPTSPAPSLDAAADGTSPGHSPKLTVSPSFKTFRHSIYASRTTRSRPRSRVSAPDTPPASDTDESGEDIPAMASSSSGGGRGPSASAKTEPPPSPPAEAAAGSSRRPSGVSAKATSDPILRNTLRYTISAREYALLHRYVLSRARQVKKRVPSVETVNRIMNPSNVSAQKKTGSGGKGKGKETEAATGLDVADVGSTSAGVGAGAGAMVGADDYNARAVRHSLRVFGATAAGLKIWGIVAERLLGQKRE